MEDEEDNYDFDDEYMDEESYKNFEFEGRKNNSNKFIRNNSAKKDIGESKKKKEELPSLKKKDFSQKDNKEKEKSLEKAKQQLALGGMGEFSLKGMKMNVKKKR